MPISEYDIFANGRTTAATDNIISVSANEAPDNIPTGIKPRNKSNDWNIPDVKASKVFLKLSKYPLKKAPTQAPTNDPPTAYRIGIVEFKGPGPLIVEKYRSENSVTTVNDETFPNTNDVSLDRSLRVLKNLFRIFLGFGS